MKNVNLYALKLFHYVAYMESFTRASEMLFISQPAITMQIRKLEEELGVKLLEPKGRGVVLTEVGKKISQIARRLVGIERDVRGYAFRHKRGTEGTVRISATYLPANYILPSALARSKQLYPALELELTTANADNAFHSLLNYDADIAVIGGVPDEPKGLKKRILKRDDLWFIVPKEHPLAKKTVAIKELNRVPFIVREEGSSMRERLFALFRTHGLQPPQIGLQMSGLNETIRTVMAGYGAIFVSALEVKDYVERGEVARVHVHETVGMTNPIAVYIRDDDALPPGADLFYHHILN
jgi:DNA-binding transcriptional LysR family regulator